MEAHPSKSGEAEAPKAAKADGLKKPDGGRVPSMQELMGIVEEKHLTRQREMDSEADSDGDRLALDSVERLGELGALVSLWVARFVVLGRLGPLTRRG